MSTCRHARFRAKEVNGLTVLHCMDCQIDTAGRGSTGEAYLKRRDDFEDAVALRAARARRAQEVKA